MTNCPSIYNLPGGWTLPVGLVPRFPDVGPDVVVLGRVGVDGLGESHLRTNACKGRQ